MLSGLYQKAARATFTRSANGATRGFAKEIKFGIEGRAAMLKGVDTLADAVQV
jgi:chaperonin GroEL